jgi:hypothetical protein
MLEGLGSLFERRKDAVAPFHKSLRDWLADDRSAGAKFVVDIAAGVGRLVKPLTENFDRWTEAIGDTLLDPFCEIELLSQLTRPESDPSKFRDFVLRLADSNVICRRVLMNTTANEDVRRGARHHYRDFVERIAKAWPRNTDDIILWGLIEALAACAWTGVTDEFGPRGVAWWEDVQPPMLEAQMPEVNRRYNEWNEAVLLLVTTVDAAGAVASSRPNLIPRLCTVMNSKLLSFISTQANGLVSRVFSATSGREYLPERNLSFLRASAIAVYKKFREDPRALLSPEWAKGLQI